MPGELFSPPSYALSANATPYSGAKWEFFASGTTTPLSVYADATLTTPLANPVVADSRGRFPNVYFDITQAYRGVCKNATGSDTLHDIDPVNTGTFALLIGQDVGVFDTLGDVIVSEGTGLVQTSGYSEVGRGGGTYVNDSIADAALLADHPLTVTVDANGLIVRPIPLNAQLGLPVTLAGVFGTNTPIHTANHQPAIYALMRYLWDVGGKTLELERDKHYSCWVPTRTAPVDNIGGGTANGGAQWSTASDGCPFYINQRLHIEGNGATLWRRAPGGADPNVWTNFQAIASSDGVTGMRWRGGSFFHVAASTTNTAIDLRATFSMRGIKLRGGIPRGSSFNYPMNTSPGWTSGDGWDVFDHCISQEPDGYSPMVDLEDVNIDGFRGELGYFTNDQTSRVRIRKFRGSNTNGQILNPNGAELDIDGVFGELGSQAIEGSGHGRIVNAQFRDCNSGGSISGGVDHLGTRLASGKIPSLAIDAKFMRCPNLGVGSWLDGTMRFIDCAPLLGNNNVPSVGNSLNIDVELDEQSGLDGVGFGGSTVGTMLVRDNSIRLTARRTKAARDAGRKFSKPVNWGNSVGPGVRVHTTIDPGDFTQRCGWYATPLDYDPIITGDALEMFGNGDGGALQDVAATPQLSRFPPMMTVFVGSGSGAREITFDATTANIKIHNGQVFRLLNGDGTIPVYIANTSASGRSHNEPTIVPPGAWAELVWDDTLAAFRLTRRPTAFSLTVARLPTASKCSGARGFVTDATATTFASVVAGGAGGEVPVHCKGNQWRIG